MAAQAASQQANLPSAAAALREPILLATHGGFSFYKVWIDPNDVQWNPKHLITDNVVAATCKQARGEATVSGSPAGAPCASGDNSCPYTTSECALTSETGCESPMLATALEMGCASADSPACRDRAAASLAGTNFGCLWTHRGSNWHDKGACGICRCNAAQWPGNPVRGTASAGASCAQIYTVCQEGRKYSTDGTVWNGCTPDATGGCTSGVAGAAWPDTPMEHWAFCVGVVECECVHGRCDMASPVGACLNGTCHPGWSGALCDVPCDSSFCLLRNDGAVPPPAGSVPSTSNGVWTTAQNECYCECSTHYEPSGTGDHTVVCGTCMQPRQSQCSPHDVRSLASRTAPQEAAVGSEFYVTVEAVTATGQIDTSATDTILVSKDAGGGNGGGGALVVRTSSARLIGGVLTFTFQLTAACEACYLNFRDDQGSLRALRYGPVRIVAAATHLLAATRHSEVSVGQQLHIVVRAVDGAVNGPGFVAVNTDGAVTARLQTTPSGGNGGGCSISPVAPSTSLSQLLHNGETVFRIAFSCACAACVVVFEHAGTSPLPPLSYPPVLVLSTGNRLRCVDAAGADCGPPPITIPRGTGSFNFTLEAVDAKGSRDVRSATVVEVAMELGSGQLLNFGGAKSLTQQLIAGKADYSLSFTEANPRLLLLATDVGTSVSPLARYSFPVVVVSTTAVKLGVPGTVPSSVNVGEKFSVTTIAWDSKLSRDYSWEGVLNATVMPFGGNGGGGDLVDGDTFPPLRVAVANGTYTWNLHFTTACSACVVQFSDQAGVLAPVQLPPIAVLTRRVRIATRHSLPEQVTVLTPFDVLVQAVGAGGGVDTTDDAEVSMELLPGGGNGDGGTLSDPGGLKKQLSGGLVPYRLTFDRPCTACTIRVTHGKDVPELLLGPILVRSPATRLVFADPPGVPATTPRGQPFDVKVRAVDSFGFTDPEARTSLFRLQKTGAAGADGGVLSNAGSVAALSKTMTGGEVGWSPQMSEACAPCFLEVVDTSGALPPLRSDAVLVTTAAVKLWPASAWASSPDTVPLTVWKGEVYEAVVIAVDAHMDRAFGSTIPITVQLEPEGGNGGGGPLQVLSAGGSTQRASFGEARFRVSHPRACDACRLTFTAGESVRSVMFPPVRVLTNASRLLASPPPPATVERRTQFTMTVLAVDDIGDRAVWAGSAGVRLLPSGGGGELQNGGGGASLVQRLSDGKADFSLSFTQSCLACIVQVYDRDGNMPSVTLPPIRVTGQSQRLLLNLTGFTAVATAVDADGNVNPLDTSEVRVTLQDASGAETALLGGEPRRLAEGVATFGLSLPASCSGCSLVARYQPKDGGSATLYSDRGAAARLPLAAPPGSGPLPSATGSAGGGTSSGGGGSDDAVLWGVLAAVIVALTCALLVGCWIRSRGKRKKGTRPDDESSATPQSAESPAAQTRGTGAPAAQTARSPATHVSRHASPAAAAAAAVIRNQPKKAVKYPRHLANAEWEAVYSPPQHTWMATAAG